MNKELMKDQISQLRRDIDKLTNGMKIILKELIQTQSVVADIFAEVFPKELSNDNPNTIPNNNNTHELNTKIL